MFIKSCRRRSHTSTEGSFLILFSKRDTFDGSYTLGALVRRVTLRQSGHFMAGSVEIKCADALAVNDTVPAFDKACYPLFYRVADGHYHVHLSGTYGADGLPREAKQYPGLWEHLHILPSDLEDKFWAGGGHNSAGTEGPAIREWALSNINKLRRLRNGS